MEFIRELVDANHCCFSILACVLLTVSYVASLYVWRTTLSRDHPSTIKRRFFSVSCMMILAPFFCRYFMSEDSLKKGDMFEQLGLRWPGILQASVLPLFLTVVLFLGPLTMQFLSGIWKLYSGVMTDHWLYYSKSHTEDLSLSKMKDNANLKQLGPFMSSATSSSSSSPNSRRRSISSIVQSKSSMNIGPVIPEATSPLALTDETTDSLGTATTAPSEPLHWFSSWQDLVWVRNHIMAPLSEEWVFRACMIPLLVQCLQPMTAVFVGPLLFGIAHFHHMFEQMKSGYEFKTALMISTFQFTYTSLFGAYSAFIFVRTGHFAAPLIAHMFCNHMGFPNFGEVGHFSLLPRVIIICNFLLGFALWCLLLMPITEPELYSNKLHWET